MSVALSKWDKEGKGQLIQKLVPKPKNSNNNNNFSAQWPSEKSKQTKQQQQKKKKVKNRKKGRGRHSKHWPLCQGEKNKTSSHPCADQIQVSSEHKEHLYSLIYIVLNHRAQTWKLSTYMINNPSQPCRVLKCI